MNQSRSSSCKVLFVCDAFWPYAGGAEACAVTVLSKLAHRGLEISVLTHRFQGTSSVRTYQRLKLRRETLFRPRSVVPLTIDFFHRILFYVKGILVISKHVQKTKPHVILSQQLISVPAVIISKFFRIPIVVVVHDYWPICYNRTILKKNGQVCSSCDSCLSDVFNCAENDIHTFLHMPGILHFVSAALYSSLMLIHTFFAKYLLKKADAIIAVSDFVKKTLVSNGFDAQKISVVYNPIINKGRIKTETQDIPCILYVGRLEFEKGTEFLLKALPKVLQTIKPVKVIIIGEGREEERLRNLSRNLQIENYVRFLRRVPDDVLWSLYKSCTVVVVPSIWPEPFGRVVAEAIICNKPIVASNVGGISELINERRGVLVKPKNPEVLADAVISVVADRFLPSDNLEIRKRCSPDYITNQYSGIIKSLTQNHCYLEESWK